MAKSSRFRAWLVKRVVRVSRTIEKDNWFTILLTCNVDCRRRTFWNQHSFSGILQHDILILAWLVRLPDMITFVFPFRRNRHRRLSRRYYSSIVQTYLSLCSRTFSDWLQGYYSRGQTFEHLIFVTFSLFLMFRCYLFKQWFFGWLTKRTFVKFSAFFRSKRTKECTKFYKCAFYDVRVRLINHVLIALLPRVWSQKTAKCGKNISDTFLFLPHFDVICYPYVSRRMATWNLFCH